MNDREDSSTSKSSCWDTASLKENWPKENAISYWRLFSFCTPWELFLLFIGLLMSIIKALTLSAVVIIYSEFTAMLVDRTLRVGTSSKTYALPIFKGGKTLTNASIEENNQELYNDSISYGFLLTIASLIMLVTGIFSVDIFNMIALRQVTRIRMKLFQKVMRQDIGWHDTAMKRNFTQNMIDDIEKIRDGISEKVAHFFYLIFGFIITVAISFAYGWKLTLAVSVYIPIVICLNYFVGQFQSRLTLKEHEAYSEAGNLVEEVLSSIRTVVAFGGEMKESQRYDNYLIPARKASQRKGAFSGLTDSVLKSMLFLSCAGAFWYGVNLILNDRNLDEKEYTPAILMIAFFGIIIGADNIARTSPFLESFAIARGCASTIFRVIDSTTKIDPLSTDGKILNYGLRGDIEFTDVYFRYPCRPDVIVHCGLNLKIRAGQTVALVGPSGCGKTTCIQLLQRFYDPLYGSILLDDFDLRKYNIQWLRSNMAVVAQESILFRGTIAENISYGKPKATQKEIEEAAKAANIHDFISNLPESYGTLIGGGGSTELSGGQKQRIAIARALIQNPKILLLDEATSALDYHSEKLVQDALDLACRGRTTIIVSHRLSTIRKADKIAFLHEGKVIEEGTHDELMILEGAYYNMIKAGEIQIPSLDNIEEKGDDIAQIKIQNSIALEKNHLEIRNESNSAERKANNYKQNDQINSLNHCNKDAPLVIKSCEKDKPNICATFARILKMAKPEWCFLILGTLCAIGFGFTYPGFSIVFGEFYAALAEIDENVAFNKTAFLSICCLVLGLLTAVAAFMQTYLFHYAGIWLTTRMRSMTFKTILKQEIAWFEEPKNAVGSLSARLAGDASDVQSAIGYPLSGLIQAISNFIISSTLCFYYSWKLTLLCLTTCPVIVGSVIFEAKYMTSTMLKEKEILENACRLATDSVINIRTIAGLRREQQIINEYNREIRKVEQLLWQKLKYRGIINSTGQSFLFFAYAIALCYGGVLVSENQIPFQDIIKVSEALLYGSMMLAQSLAFAPAFSAALVAGHRLFQILDRKPLITSPSSLMGNSFGFTKQLNNPYEGIRYHNIDFRYSSRPDVKVLNSFNLEIPQGFTVALIGPSGSGKSTCLHLLQRYYDAENGSIHINNDNIYTDIGLNDLRYQLSIVSQEPILFQRSIAENIAYGDNMRDVSMSEIIAAAKSANAHDFITTLPYGYDTRMGARGSQLSGGQKQRLAIARALIRNPRILLLDEATSALDTQSEQLVQQALDGARAGRTCIIIAHRLATIQNANLICVLHNGQILEAGNHQQLLEKNGLYAKLHQSKLPQ